MVHSEGAAAARNSAEARSLVEGPRPVIENLLEDPLVLLAMAPKAEREARGLPVYPLDERFLAALAAGLPPCSGNAIGLDRLAALAAGTTRIGEVIAFTDDEL